MATYYCLHCGMRLCGTSGSLGVPQRGALKRWILMPVGGGCCRSVTLGQCVLCVGTMGCSSSKADDTAVTSENPMVVRHRLLNGTASSQPHAVGCCERDPEFQAKQREEDAAMSFTSTYSIEKKIGEGKYAEVFLVKNKKTNLMFAAKCIPSSKLVDQEDVKVRPQVAVHSIRLSRVAAGFGSRDQDHEEDGPPTLGEARRLLHRKRHILPCARIDDRWRAVRCHCQEGGCSHACTQLVSSMPMHECCVWQEYYSEAEAKVFVRTLADALAYCHRHDVVHRDLKVSRVSAQAVCTWDCVHR